MAEIDKSKPIVPIWPTPPGRKVEYDDESQAEQQRRNRRERDDEEKKDDNGPGHIDEYV